MADEKNPDTNNNSQTRAEWERERAAELDARDKTALAVKVAQLEYDLKEARNQRDDARSNLPKEGERVLTKSEAERYDAYLKLGKPDDIATMQQEHGVLKANEAKAEWRKGMESAAQVAGFKPSVLEKLSPEGATYEVRTVTVDGKEAKVAYIKDAQGKESTLTDFAKTNFDQDFMPALVVSGSDKPADPPKPGWVGGGKPAAAGDTSKVNPIAASLQPAGGEVKEVSLFSKE